MEAVIIPGKTVVHVGGVPVRLAFDTLVETAKPGLLVAWQDRMFLPREAKTQRVANAGE